MSDFLGGLGLLREYSTWLVGTGRGTPETASAYKRAILAFFCDVLPVSLGDLDETTCFAYLLTLAPNRRNDIGKALCSFMGWADGRGYLPQGNPMRDYIVRRIPPGRVKYLTGDQLVAFFGAASEYPDLRAAPTFALMLGTGARIGSVIAARCEDVDLSAGRESVYWRKAKNNRTYTSVLSPEHSLPGAVRLIELAGAGYTRGRGVERDPALLIGVKHPESVRYWMREIARKAGVPSELAHPHAIRRTFGTILARTHADLATWVAAMGHSDGNSFIRYAAAEDDRLREAVSRIPSPIPVAPLDSPTPLMAGTPYSA